MATVQVTSRNGLTHEITARGHTVLSDEPREDGGQDRGGTPYELLLGALGACAAITVRLYAERKGWPLESVEVTLSHARGHVQDCRDSEERDVRLEVISKRLSLKGDLDEAQRTRLAQIAERCPVQRTLTSGGLRIEQDVV